MVSQFLSCRQLVSRSKLEQMNNRYIITFFILLMKLTIGSGQTLFFDEFENNLQGWEYQDTSVYQRFLTQDSLHKSVLKLIPNKTTECILIKNSENWDAVAIEGQVLFPSDQHNYLGLVYNYQKNERTDFGCIYIKGNGNYVRVNPHRDGNASRALYEEYKTSLTSEREIRTNEWVSFRAEIIGPECHFYVQNLNSPIITFKHLELTNGKIGFKTRFSGGECWLDNLSVQRIKEFSHSTQEASETLTYNKDKMITEWLAIGPFNNRIEEIEKSKGNNAVLLSKTQYNWFNFNSDERGCVVAGMLCRYSSEENFAYFSTTIQKDEKDKAELLFSSLNNLHIWVNAVYIGMIEKQKYAWYDFDRIPEHIGRSIPINLEEGDNRLLILVEGANYSGDGFYSMIESNK